MTIDPAYEPLADFRKRMWDMVDPDVDHDTITVSFGEFARLLEMMDGWIKVVDQPEDPAMKIIREAAALLAPKQDEAVFTVKVSPDNTKMHVKAGSETDPATVLNKAIEALQAEREDLHKCPAHQP